MTENRPPFRTEQAAGSLAVFSEFILITFSYLPSKVQDTSIDTLSLSQSVSQGLLIFESSQHSRVTLWAFWQFIRVMRGLDLTNKKTVTKTKTMAMANTLREHLQRAILETCDLWDIWSKWWGDMTWPTKSQWDRQRQRQWQRQIHLENTFKERS